MYRYRKSSWPERHPLLLVVGVVLGAGIVAALWWLFLAAAALAGIGLVVFCICQYVEHQKRLGYRGRAELAAQEIWISGDPRET